ncbi:glycosyl transferase [Vibrio ichthyoenteri ATCC 700023]|uniref:Glycosyl transferase n=1 Tax=Vibrio ichthyoenteri ATCC 700023 TaxID=870968 RepID=F9RWF0_9VIBR|nr:MJ1255/VC2487 family glycosyltransferase [Vibrio ichthyoenteri]EGU49207.1 glycosyl transferase [Vibrio ichthyoenteri ATCC 700023]
MKILYGVQGTGNGHIARARAMCDALKEKEVEVDFLFSGREADKYFAMQAFGDYRIRRGLTFITEKGKVNYRQTILENSLFEFYQEVSALDLSGYDLVLNDFEPVSAWAAKIQKKPIISISHQNAFRYPVPLKGASWLDKQVIRYFAPSSIHLGLHWHHFNQPILPPIIHTKREDVDSQAYVLVYLPFESLDDITDLLLRFSRQSFVCFHPQILAAKQIDNIQFFPLSLGEFQHYLNRCAGIIANGGFELPSEALTMGKKLLLKPLAGQFEQLSNVATLESLGLASSMEILDASIVRNWLDEEPGERVQYPDVASAIVDWLLKGEWDSTEQLTARLWSQVDFPSYAFNE